MVQKSVRSQGQGHKVHQGQQAKVHEKKKKKVLLVFIHLLMFNQVSKTIKESAKKESAKRIENIN